MIRPMLAILATSAAFAATAGCGGGGHGTAGTPPPVAVDVSDTGYGMADHVPGGVVAMRFRNTGAQPHEFALGRADAGHTAAELEAVVRGSVSQEPPSWLHDVAGPPLLTPGAEITITRTLAPGTYVFFDGVPDAAGDPGVARGLVKVFAVEGDSGASLPTPDAVITAEKDRYDVPALTPGTHTIELRNRSGAGRGFLLATLNPGKTDADVTRWAGALESTGRLPATPMPATVLGAMQTIPSGTSVFLTVGLDAGRQYQFSDDESGITARFTPR